MPRLLRVLFGLQVLTAIGWQLRLHVGAGYSLLNFFSYFTNLSNLLAAAVLLAAASGAAFVGTAGFAALRCASAVNMALVGLVFGALLRNVDLGDLRPWVNATLHYLMPVVVVADWWLDPPAHRLRARQLLAALAFPALYLVYTLLRGSQVGWYPYPFLNPARAGGYAGVAAYAVGITVAFAFVGWALFALGNQRRATR
ncbi:Pr6Pr family membrane protein [Pseudorhodoferax sp. Leaf267]|uniref:Pr6Pr family membrane protein n=1 Tax=Pseudorhodoferax sp. Leaf267 TaxID=1736316 RepID=UPI0006F9DDBF|nr:Pr6Pr family membrane protein [Pseudorhodoferax sp. Leaf267]KQP12765.1 hypothetical protein ASF43_21385 [Pseudorhodoferax sp. Leaf267]